MPKPRRRRRSCAATRWSSSSTSSTPPPPAPCSTPGRSAPNDLRAVHFDLDPWKTELLSDAWTRLGLSHFPLDIIECPDRRVPRAALDLAHELTLDRQTELTVLIPRREYMKRWHRMLHDRSSNPIAAALGNLPHCSVTIVPYHLGT